MSVILRAMEMRDVPKVLGLFGQLSVEMSSVPFGSVADEAQIADWLGREDISVYVAADGDLILAVIRAKRGQGNKQHAAQIALAVDERFGGRKYALQLTQHCMSCLKAEGVALVRAFVYSNNQPFIETVLSCGFTLSGSVYRHHYDDSAERFIDDLIFYKEI